MCYVDKDCPGGAESCNHSCEPNSEIVTDDKAIESNEIELDKKIYKVSYFPIFIKSIKEIKHNERPTVSYGTACVKQGKLPQEHLNFVNNSKRYSNHFSPLAK